MAAAMSAAAVVLAGLCAFRRINAMQPDALAVDFQGVAIDDRGAARNRLAGECRPGIEHPAAIPGEQKGAQNHAHKYGGRREELCPEGIAAHFGFATPVPPPMSSRVLVASASGSWGKAHGGERGGALLKVALKLPVTFQDRGRVVALPCTWGSRRDRGNRG